MFLPPVIVIKSSELESGISRLKHGILDEVDIARLWKAFASVRQHTIGPYTQACRLENFWWRVWGSKQKNLSGLELGRLCSHLYNERFSSSLRRQSDFIEESFLQTNTTSYAGRNYFEFRFAAELDPKIPLEYNSKAQSVPCIVLQPASIKSCETKTERKRISGPAISKKKNKVLNKNKKPLIARRLGSHLSTDSVRTVDGRIHRRIVKPPSKSDGVSVMNEKSNSKPLENNSKALFAETRNASALPKLKSPDHVQKKIDSKKQQTITCIEESKKVVFGDKMIEAGVSCLVRGLQNEVSRIGTDELPSKEKMNFTSMTNHLKKSRSSSNNQILTTHINSHNDSDHQSSISGNRELNENLTFSSKKYHNLDSNGQAEARGDLITLKSLSDKNHSTSSKSPVLTYLTRPMSSNETEPLTIGSQMPLNIFEKRLIQPTFSLSESTDKLSTSKSQLTLLIKKDRERFEESGLPTGK